MVKPIFPSQQQSTNRSRENSHISRQFTHSFTSREGTEDRLEGAVGYSESDISQLDEGDTFFYSSPHQDEWLTQRSAPGSPYMGESQSYNFVPVPRGRIFSLPDEGRQMPMPLPRRRTSAPTVVNVHGPRRTNADMTPALKEIATKGQELFWFILSHEVESRKAAEPDAYSHLNIPSSGQRTEILNERSPNSQRTLRQMALRFAQSSQRNSVREYAETVNIEDLTYSTFSDLLYGIFQEGGMTQGRVLVLFFFCADLALRALKQKLMNHFQHLLDWTSTYITERLSSWIYNDGGWVAVLQDSMDQMYKMVVISLCFVSACACALFIWRHCN